MYFFVSLSFGFSVRVFVPFSFLRVLVIRCAQILVDTVDANMPDKLMLAMASRKCSFFFTQNAGILPHMCLQVIQRDA